MKCRATCFRLAFLLLYLGLSACARTPSEQALRDTIAGLQSAVAARDAGQLADGLAEDFIGPDGLDREGARRLAALHFMRHSSVGMTPGPLDIQMKTDHATVKFEAAIIGGSGGWMPESGQVYEVESGWRFDNGAWRMTSLRWTPRL